MMQNARATSGGVSYCQLPLGFSVTFAYNFSGIANSLRMGVPEQGWTLVSAAGQGSAPEASMESRVSTPCGRRFESSLPPDRPRRRGEREAAR
jgi:hypothetical protein